MGRKIVFFDAKKIIFLAATLIKCVWDRRMKMKNALLVILFMAAGIMAALPDSIRHALPGLGTTDDPYLLSNRDDLLLFNRILSDSAYGVSMSKYCYRMTDDIVLEPTDKWKPVAFRGTFYGDNHTISGLVVSGDTAGLFSVVKQSRIQDLGIVDSHIEGVIAGAIAGVIASTDTSFIEHCWNLNTFVYGAFYAGGLIGNSDPECYSSDTCETIINRSYNTGNITGGGFVGGIIGYMATSFKNENFIITNSFNRGWIESTMDGNSEYIAGITNGHTSGHTIIRNVYNAGPVVYESESTPVPLASYRLLGGKNPFVKNIFKRENIWRLRSSRTDTASEAITNEDMKSREFALVMGEALAYDSLNINDGYPVISTRKVSWKSISDIPSKKNVEPESITISVLSGDIVVHGLKKGERMLLVNLKGDKVWAGSAEGAMHIVPIKGRGVYLLKSERATSKIFVK